MNTPIIGIDARMYAFTGIGRYIQELIRGLSTRPARCQYKIFTSQDIAEKLVLPSHFSTIPVDFPIYTRSEQLNFGRLLNKSNLDLLHVPHFNVPITYQGKTLLTIHDITQTAFASTSTVSARLKKLGYYAVTALAVHRAAHIVTVSAYTKHDLIRHFLVPKRKVQVIWEGIPPLKTVDTPVTLSHLSTKYGIKKPYLLYVGLWAVHKNIPRLLKSFAQVRKQHPNLTLVIAGKKDPRYEEHFLQICEEEGIKKHVIFTGFVSDAELVTLYSEATLFVFPSLSEGFGFPPLEACQYGLPVVCSNATALPEIVGDAAQYVDPTSVDDIAEGINTLLSDPQKQAALCSAGRKRFKLFSWETMVEKTETCYYKLL